MSATVPRTLSSAIVSQSDKLRMCDVLFNVKFKNQFYRVASLELIPNMRMVEDSVPLAETGIYFGGRDSDKPNCKYFLNCCFCRFETTIKPNKPGFRLDFRAICESHGKQQTVDCLAKKGNVRYKSPLSSEYGICMPESSLFPFQAFKDCPEPEELTNVELTDPNIRPTLCRRCSRRPYDIIMYGCGCMLLCHKCIADVPHDRCPGCNGKVVAYAKITNPIP